MPDRTNIRIAKASCARRSEPERLRRSRPPRHTSFLCRAAARRCCSAILSRAGERAASRVSALGRASMPSGVILMGLLAEMYESIAQWSARDANQPLEWPVQLQDQEDRTGN